MIIGISCKPFEAKINDNWCFSLRKGVKKKHSGTLDKKMTALNVLTFVLLLSINVIEPKKYLVDIDEDQISDLKEIDKRLPITSLPWQKLYPGCIPPTTPPQHSSLSIGTTHQPQQPS